MRIAFLSRYQNSIHRGAETFVYELSRRLKDRHIVDILSNHDADSLSKILSGNYEVVVSLNGGLQSLKVSLGRLPGGYKLIVVGQAGIGRVAIWNTAIVQPNVFVALTDYMHSWVGNWAWNSRVVKIHNGVDLDKFKPTGEIIKLDLPSPVILSVGALEWYKHHERTIEAMSLLEKCSLLVVGEGREKERLEALGKSKLGNRFKILRADYEDLPKIYRSADLFVLPSWDREAFGIVYLEAMASGLGVVAPDDASRRVVVGDAGLYTDVHSPTAYAEAIRKALELDWGKLARSQAEKFSWDKIAKEYEQLMLSII